jgi:hypothetical protein
MNQLLTLISGFMLGTFFVPYWPVFIKLIKNTYLYASGNYRPAGIGQDDDDVRPGHPDSAQNRPPDFRKL